MKKSHKSHLSVVGEDYEDDDIEQNLTELAKKYTKTLEGAKLDNAKGKRQQLEALLSVVKSVIPLAESSYKLKPHERNCYALTNLMSTAREIIQELASVTDNEELFNQLRKRMINYQRSVLKVISTELGEFQRNAIPYVKPEKTIKFKNGLNDALRQVGESMKSEHGGFIRELEELLGVQNAECRTDR